MSFQIEGKTCLVTGANRGIGKSIVETFVRQGAARVYAAVRNPDSAAPMVQELGPKVVPIQLDLGDPATIAQAAGAAADVQLVVNNAGILQVGDPLADDAIDALRQQVEINVIGLMRMAQAFAPVLRANGGGAFVQLNSVASMKCFAGFATYSASKAAAYSITQALREVLAPQGTAVLSVHPGPIATDMADAAGLGAIAEPPTLVGDAIVRALAAGEFHVFPDTMARQIGAAYDGFARNVVEAKIGEG